VAKGGGVVGTSSSVGRTPRSPTLGCVLLMGFFVAVAPVEAIGASFAETIGAEAPTSLTSGSKPQAAVPPRLMGVGSSEEVLQLAETQGLVVDVTEDALWLVVPRLTGTDLAGPLASCFCGPPSCGGARTYGKLTFFGV